MHITIAICTHNRAPMLRDTLQSLLAMESDIPGSYDVLVVDNNSTDATSQIVSEFSEKSPTQIWYYFEAKTGLVHARNAAIETARGDIIAFTDDDIFFDSQWLKALYRVFETHPAIDCVAGKVVPLFEAPRPDWLDQDPEWLNIGGMYGTTNFGETDRVLTYPEHPVGANMAFRRRTFSLVGHFDPSLGRYGKSLLSKEESELFERIYRARLTTFYSSQARVVHRIPSERIGRKWIIRRFYWQGRSQVIFENKISAQDRTLLLTAIKTDLVGIWRVVVGGSVAPRAIYWQLRRLRFWHAVYLVQVIGSLMERLKYMLKAVPKNRES